MAIGRRKKAQGVIASAAAVDLNNPLWPVYASLDSAWQVELWRLYDCVPEFARCANYVGQACSRVRIYVAEVDERGQVQKEVLPTNPVGKLASTVLGGPESQPELLNLMGTAMMVSGEYWTIGLDALGAGEEFDRWFVVQFNELKRLEDFFAYPGAQPQRQFAYSFGSKEYTLREGRDIIFRTWTPHPQNTICSYSPGRSLMMTLTELEILTQYILAQARSRLASGGVWFLPNNLEFPAQDDYPAGMPGLFQRLMDGAKFNITSFGSASQLVPILAGADPVALAAIKDPIIFGSILSEQASQLRAECRGTVAKGMDVAPEIVNGMSDSNHWNGPAIEQSTVDNVVKPVMTRICNALTDQYLKPVLKMRGKDPGKYKYWYDIASLVTRPNKLKETMELAAAGFVGEDEVLKAADLPESAKISKEEDQRNFARTLLKSDAANLLQIPELREKADIGIKDISMPAPPLPGQPGGPGIGGAQGRPPAPPPPERTLKNVNPTAQPERSTLPGAPNNAVPGPKDKQLSASAQWAVMTLADAQVRQALEKAGKALLRGPGGAEFRNMAPDEAYMSFDVSRPRAFQLLQTSFGHIEPMMRDQEIPGDPHILRSVLLDYATTLMNEHKPHEPRIMRGYLERGGLL